MKSDIAGNYQILFLFYGGFLWFHGVKAFLSFFKLFLNVGHHGWPTTKNQNKALAETP